MYDKVEAGNKSKEIGYSIEESRESLGV